ncbi:MAG: peptidylprolyl isomerase [Myxococcota bacterium]
MTKFRALRARRGAAFSAICGLILAISLFAATAGRAAERVVEAIAAQVGSEVILLSEVMELSAPIEGRMRQAGAPPQEIIRVRKEALDRLIETKLIGSVVERLELGADRDQVDAAIAAIAADNSLSLEQLLRSVVDHGLQLEEYRAKIKGEIERSNVVNTMVRSRVQITKEEVEALYQERFSGQRSGGHEFHLRHILVSPKESHADGLAAACQVVREARAQIVSGDAEFAAIAQRVSSMNPEQGGELGWMHAEDLAAWMAGPIDALQPGELSEVIQMPFGCNLLEVVDRRVFERIELSDAKAQLQNIVFQRKMEIEYTRWIDELREHTYIERKAGFGG